MTIPGADISHHQSANLAQAKSAIAFVVLKATEGTGYVDPTFAPRRAQAHAAGLIVGHYHFARAGNATAEAQFFLRTVGDLQPGEFLVLDWEVPGANPPGWCKTWLDTVYQATGVRPLIYMNQSAVNGSNWSAVAADYGLWLARYDGSTAQPSVAYWGAPAMKQYSDKGTVAGIGQCDVDVFFGTEQQLLAYGKGGKTPTPSIVQEDDDMKLVRSNETGTVYEFTDFTYTAIPDNPTYGAEQHAGYPTAGMPQAEIDLLIARVEARKVALAEVLWGHPFPKAQGQQDDTWPLDRLRGIDGKTTEIADAIGQVQAPAVDEVKLAEALAPLLADPKIVGLLGAALAANLQLTPRNA